MPTQSSRIGDALLMQYKQDPRYMLGMQGIETGSSTAPVHNPLEGLARALTGVVGAYQVKNAREDYEGKQAAIDKALADALASPNPQQALLSSDNADVRNMVMPGMIDALSKSPEYSTTPQQLADGSWALIGKDGSVKRLDTGIAPDPNKPFTYGAGGVTANQPYQNYEMNRSRAGATNVNVNTMAQPFYQGLGEGAAKDLLTRQEGARTAAKSLQNIYEIQPMVDQMFTGPFAKVQTQVAKILGEDPSKVANTEAFGAVIAQQVAQIIKQFGSGTGLSDSDREYAKQAAGGDITMNRESISKILDINRRAAANVISAYNRDAQRVMQSSPYSLPTDLTVEVPKGPDLSPPGGTTGIQSQGATPEGVDPNVWKYMTPEERALWQK